MDPRLSKGELLTVSGWYLADNIVKPNAPKLQIPFATDIKYRGRFALAAAVSLGAF